MATDTARPSERAIPGNAPAWVEAAVGVVADAVPMRSGFTNESWAVTAPDGRRVVATRYRDQRTPGRLLDLAPALGARLTEAGITSPVPIAELSDREASVVVSQLVDGVSAMDLMTDDAAAEHVGSLAGAAWLALGRVDASGLALDDLWARPSGLTQAALSWLEPVEASLRAGVTQRVRARIAELPSLLDGRPAGFVHGDLVPANLVVARGRLAAVTDFEDVRLGERLLDAAWFRWIVGYHHPAIAGAAWRGFVEHAHLDGRDELVTSLIEILPVVRILEILAGPAVSAADRERWVEQLHAAVGAPSR